MSKKILLSFYLAIAALISVLLVYRWNHSSPTFQTLPKIASAAQRYSRDQISRGKPLPASITLQDLRAAGYVSSEELRDYEGMQVTFYTGADEAKPNSVLARVRMRDGSQIEAHADGSIQQTK